MARRIGELPGGCLKVKKSKTIEGCKYEVRAKSYYGTLAGWNIYIDGKFVRFHNGQDFQNRYDPEQILSWAIRNL